MKEKREGFIVNFDQASIALLLHVAKALISSPAFQPLLRRLHLNRDGYHHDRELTGNDSCRV
jgi:hypothetical protein